MPGSNRAAQANRWWDRSVLAPSAVFLALAALTAWRLASTWRWFDRFLWDDGWYLQVARRVAGGETLYRDVAWDYGPLPVHALAWLLRISPTVVWFHVLDAALIALALAAVYVAGRTVLSRGVALAVTLWVAVLGGPTGLISHQLEAYTAPVAWGTSLALATTAAACVWVKGKRRAALIATAALASLSVLSKPEYGLAGVAVLIAAVVLVRPSRPWGLVAAGTAIALFMFGLPGPDPESLAAFRRGYSGYDLIAVGSVPVVDAGAMFGGLLVAAVVIAALFGLVRVRSPWIALAALAVLVGLTALAERSNFLHAMGIVCRAAWQGTIPAVILLGGLMLRRRLPPAAWILGIHSLGVALRGFLLGAPHPAATATTVLLLCLLVRRGVLPRPTRAGWLVLLVFLGFSSVESEWRSLRPPRDLRPVGTALGTVRLPAPRARIVRFVQEAAAEAPAGGLFVAGGGPGWYLVCDRANPTVFDALWYGLGTTSPEADLILEDLRRNPPRLLLVENEFAFSDELPLDGIQAASGEPLTRGGTSPDGRWTWWTVNPE